MPPFVGGLFVYCIVMVTAMAACLMNDLLSFMFVFGSVF